MTETTVHSLVEQLKVCKSTMATMQKQKADLEERLLKAIEGDIKAQLADKDYGTGTANIVSGNHKIKVVISKKVDWDGNHLAALFTDLAERGQDPKEYIDLEYSVPENRYKAWPSGLQAMFEPARTVKVGKPSITIEE